MPRNRPDLVFDLDGTLSDPFDGIWQSTNYALEAFGHQTVSRDAFRRFIGPPIDQTFGELVPDASRAAIIELVEKFRERYGRVGYRENVLYQGIPQLLDALIGAGFRCSVCTAKRHDFAVKVLRLFGLEGYFDLVEGGDVGIRKVDQLAGLRAREQIGPRAIMIGDRATDVEAANAAGLRGIGVLWGYGSSEELEAASPWAVVDSPTALQTLLLAED